MNIVCLNIACMNIVCMNICMCMNILLPGMRIVAVIKLSTTGVLPIMNQSDFSVIH